MCAFIIILLGIERGLVFCVFNFVDLPDSSPDFIEQKSS